MLDESINRKNGPLQLFFRGLKELFIVISVWQAAHSSMSWKVGAVAIVAGPFLHQRAKESSRNQLSAAIFYHVLLHMVGNGTEKPSHSNHSNIIRKGTIANQSGELLRWHCTPQCIEFMTLSSNSGLQSALVPSITSWLFAWNPSSRIHIILSLYEFVIFLVKIHRRTFACLKRANSAASAMSLDISSFQPTKYPHHSPSPMWQMITLKHNVVYSIHRNYSTLTQLRLPNHRPFEETFLGVSCLAFSPSEQKLPKFRIALILWNRWKPLHHGGQLLDLVRNLRTTACHLGLGGSGWWVPLCEDLGSQTQMFLLLFFCGALNVCMRT